MDLINVSRPFGSNSSSILIGTSSSKTSAEARGCTIARNLTNNRQPHAQVSLFLGTESRRVTTKQPAWIVDYAFPSAQQPPHTHTLPPSIYREAPLTCDKRLKPPPSTATSFSFPSLPAPVCQATVDALVAPAVPLRFEIGVGFFPSSLVASRPASLPSVATPATLTMSSDIMDDSVFDDDIENDSDAFSPEPVC